MAAILRSSVIRTVRRAFSVEGTLSVRALHTGRNNPTAYASCAKKNLKPAEVDPLSKKIDDDARKESVIGYTKRSDWMLKLNKDPVVDKVLYYMTYVSAAGTFLLGYEFGKSESSLAKKCQESSGKEARRVDDLI